MDKREPLNIRIEASVEKIAEATLAALKMGVWGTYNAMVIGWSAAQMRKLGEPVPKAPAETRRGFMRTAFDQAIQALPPSNPFKEALEQMATYDIAGIKD